MNKFFVFIVSIILSYYYTNSLSSTSYPNSKQCIAVIPNKKNDCNDIGSDYIYDKEIACCYVTYSSSEEGSVKKCIPLYKTINGLHMYEQQLKNVRASSISMDCSSKKILISYFASIILILLF